MSAKSSIRWMEMPRTGRKQFSHFVLAKHRQPIELKREKKCTQPCSMQPVFIAWRRSGKTVKNSSLSQKKSGSSLTRKGGDEAHQTEWCSTTSKYRCMRCGRGRQVHEDERTMYRTEILGKELWKMGEGSMWRT